MSEVNQRSIDFFKENNFVRFGSVISKEWHQIFSNYALMKAKGSFSPDTEISVMTHGVYGDTLMECLLQTCRPAVQRGTGLSLLPTYSYYRVYPSGVAVKRHKCPPSNEIRAILCLGFDYSLGGDNSYSWEILLDETGGEGRVGQGIKTYPGSMLVYRGDMLECWRNTYDVPRSGWYAEVFLNYVDSDGPYSELCRFDGRRGVGAPLCTVDMKKAYDIQKLTEEVREKNSPSKAIKSSEYAKLELIDHSRLELNDEDDMSFQLLHSKGNKYPILLVDNLYKDPEYVRDLGLDLHYTNEQASISLPTHDFWEFLFRSFAHLYGFSAKGLKDFGRPYFRYFLRDPSGPKPLVSSNLLQGLISLSDEKKVQGRVNFFQHKELKIEELVSERGILEWILRAKEKRKGGKTFLDQRFVKMLMDMGLLSQYSVLRESGKVSSYENMIKEISAEEKWELTQEIEMKFNRLVCFPGFLLHSFSEEMGKKMMYQNFSVTWPSKLE
jgi:hypothetical protein